MCLNLCIKYYTGDLGGSRTPTMGTGIPRSIRLNYGAFGGRKLINVDEKNVLSKDSIKNIHRYMQTFHTERNDSI